MPESAPRMPAGVQIQPYTADRAQEMADLFQRSVHAIDRTLYTNEQLNAWAPSPVDYGAWQRRLARKQPWLALHHDRVVGFIELDPDGHIDALYTDPELQRRGIASLLYRRLERTARERGLGRLRVEASAVARPFFTRQGFRLQGTQRVVRQGMVLLNFRMQKSLHGE